jgi:hypothetical protein
MQGKQGVLAWAHLPTPPLNLLNGTHSLKLVTFFKYLKALLRGIFLMAWAVSLVFWKCVISQVRNLWFKYQWLLHVGLAYYMVIEYIGREYGKSSSYGPVFLLWVSSSTVETISSTMLHSNEKISNFLFFFGAKFQNHRINGFHGRAADPQ